MANDRQLPEKKRSDDPLPPRAPDSSTQLAGLAMAGDRDALERLCARYLPRVRGWARGLLPSRARGMWDTSDLASEALARTARRIAAFDRSRGTFRVFLRMILNNCLLDVIRSVDRRPVGAPLLEDKPDPAPSPLEQAMAAERRERYLAALATLKRDDQELIQARFEKGLSFVEQAQARGTTPDAVRVRTGRALVKLLNEMNRSETATPAPSNPGPSATRDDRTLGEDYSLILEAARLPSPGPTSD